MKKEKKKQNQHREARRSGSENKRVAGKKGAGAAAGRASRRGGKRHSAAHGARTAGKSTAHRAPWRPEPEETDREALPEADRLQLASEEAERRRRSREVLLALMGDPLYRPMRAREIAALLGVPKERRSELQQALLQLVRDGSAVIGAKGHYEKADRHCVTGMFQGNSRGFGFVTVEGREEDLFIPPDCCGDAMDGDEVRVLLQKERGGRRAEGRVLRVLRHANETLVGTYRKNGKIGFVIPDNQRITRDIFIRPGCDLGAETGSKVVVRMLSYGDGSLPEEEGGLFRTEAERAQSGDGGAPAKAPAPGGRPQSSPEGEIAEILGQADAPGVDILSVVRNYRLPEAFPEAVSEELSAVPDTVSEAAKKGRLDLRGEQTVTIDGEDAKDLDDAISLRFDPESGIYTLGVHIADVSAYVPEGSALDREAERRGTSVYLPDRVIPMLPRRLSNGICSLNQGEDRLALSCIMEIDAEGKVRAHQIAESVIRVNRRMSYTNVNAILVKRDRRRAEQFAEYVPLFERMQALSGILRRRRSARGGIDFDFPESKITLDRKGRVTEIAPYERDTAQLMIEDFMLAANETVAETCYWQQLPFLYRTHEAPEPEKLRALSGLFGHLGYEVRGLGKTADSVHPKAVQTLLEKASGSDEEAMIARLVLRSMKQARYTTECIGHFGLAAKYYTHFTSPIRRYPDLQIHRIIKEALQNGLSETRSAHYETILPQVADDASRCERRADEAERDCEKMKKCEYMRKFIGEEFDGVISGVTSFGFYVELPNTCEGLVHISTLADDYYVYDEASMELLGERRGNRYRLGQPVHIMVTGADKALRTVDFRLVRKENNCETSS